MKKYIIGVITVLLMVQIPLFSQEMNETIKTKMEVLTSKTRVKIKFTNTSMPPVKAYLTAANTRIRKVEVGKQVHYFYQIEKTGETQTITASIEYSDLVELIKAIASMKNEVGPDVSGNPDYLENKYITSDGLSAGYYILKGKVNWYIRLENHGSGKTLLVNDVETIETAFISAKDKIDELKRNR